MDVDNWRRALNILGDCYSVLRTQDSNLPSRAESRKPGEEVVLSRAAVSSSDRELI